MTTAHHGPGETRPGGRTARTRQAVLTAVFQELGDGGFAALTMERVAQRSGIHVATLYRRWRSTEGLVCDLLTDLSSDVPLPDSGTLPGDLQELAGSIATFYGEARMRRLIEAVVSAAARDPEAAAVLRTFFGERLALAGRMVERAVERGELPADTDPEKVMSALGAPFYYRILIARRPVDQDLAASAATAVWAAARAGAYGRQDDGPAHDTSPGG
ncbi:transcriptional regulator, TetR family [Streptomyces sp. 2224.1]|uniref:TetR/AcrR family transcriptional regulator n=1 Tax=unclassified Streptomyces TaxID=2593676 RepID=UPI00088307A0|nr:MULTISPECIES: TetR/AcrR family transcriptional regulator [unclassified Streptomyces]PBC83783.1 TetR family transcriptional regulator [Streptomyces sp. 2321.6]SDR38763.1 transcriptional regulator, TetR family [Streptomyces sp. KS_16]SEB94022.1 transcriptional regulator, TetR family [Streptomyces sp. 2224.1]SED07869.1 transcriptional regulator, TetR family [Streptomyces sp. 2133.1]SEE69282.1 transcriptional regulator, TetR family [Streptomyces sp. 2112.3]